MDLMPTLSAAWKARVKFLRCKRDCVRGRTAYAGAAASTCHQHTQASPRGPGHGASPVLTAPHRPGPNACTFTTEKAPSHPSARSPLNPQS